MSTEQFSLFLLLALIRFFFLQPDLSATSPANVGFVTSQHGLLNAKRGSSRRLRTKATPLWAPNCSFTRCLNRTDTVSEHSECNSSPKAPTEGIGRRKTHDMLCWANRCKGFIYVQGQGHKDFYPHPDNVKAQGPVSIDFVPSVQTAT